MFCLNFNDRARERAHILIQRAARAYIIVRRWHTISHTPASRAPEFTSRGLRIKVCTRPPSCALIVCVCKFCILYMRVWLGVVFFLFAFTLWPARVDSAKREQPRHAQREACNSFAYIVARASLCCALSSWCLFSANARLFVHTSGRCERRWPSRI